MTWAVFTDLIPQWKSGMLKTAYYIHYTKETVIIIDIISFTHNVQIYCLFIHVNSDSRLLLIIN